MVWLISAFFFACTLCGFIGFVLGLAAEGPAPKPIKRAVPVRD